MKKELISSLNLESSVEGLKVISVRRGSVTADISIIYQKSVTREEAFKSFFVSAMEYAKRNNNAGGLRILPDMKPTMQVIPDDGGDDYFVMTVALVVVVIIAAIVMILAAIWCFHRKRNGNSSVKDPDVQGVDNHGIDVQQMQIQVVTKGSSQ